MPLKRIAHWSTSLSIPDSNGAVEGSGDDVPPIGRVSHGQHPVSVPLKGIANWRTSLGIPDSNGAVGGSGDDVAPIGRVSNGHYCNKTGRWPALFLTLSLTLWRSLHYITLLYITLGRSFITLLYSTLPLGGLFITLHYSTLLGTLFLTLLYICALYGVCPSRGSPTGAPVSASQIRMVLSSDPEMMFCPSGE